MHFQFKFTNFPYYIWDFSFFFPWASEFVFQKHTMSVLCLKYIMNSCLSLASYTSFFDLMHFTLK